MVGLLAGVVTGVLGDPYLLFLMSTYNSAEKR